MVKKTGLISLFILCIMLASCGSNQETVTYYYDDDTHLEEITITAEDNEIIEHTTKVTIEYEDVGYESKEKAQESIDFSESEDMKSVDGIDVNQTFGDDKFVHNVTYDFSVIDPSEASGELREFLEAEESRDFEIQVQELEDAGFEEAEE
ncbi:DUF1307 domain-containing protein [Oceanobacillus jeddahense]|uniref:DUF1307 domain-containing protein n=1 Tax=Oceanobacillus jeddahense TaxID=1462527 RepID=A0ABY5JWK0_9BACI|nr:DUF1307 domain-containing protein [Oceanobacillus jeddahense]UUI03792.1 DUF1307 domain-containing protein [Oceanobacillus jeddahense]